VLVIIQNNREALKNEEESYKPIPVIRNVDQGMVQRNYMQIKHIRDLIESETQRITDNPSWRYLLLKNKTLKYANKKTVTLPDE
jgi:hypothetical protein